MIASVMVARWSEVPRVCPRTAPQPLCGRGFIDDGLASWGWGGKRFQSYGPQIASYADMFGLILEARIRLRVVLTCKVNLSHICRGNLLLVVARALIK